MVSLLFTGFLQILSCKSKNDLRGSYFGIFLKRLLVFIKFLFLLGLLNVRLVNADHPPTFTMAIPEIPPLGCQKQAQKLPCLLNTLAEKIAEYSNLNIEIQILPFPRMIRALQEGKVDLIIYPKHHPLPSNMKPVALSHISNATLLTKNIDLLLDKPINKRIPLFRGMHQAEFHEELGDYTRVPVLDLNQMFGMFAKNRIDAVIGSKAYLMGGLQRFGININDVLEPAPPIRVEAWLYCKEGKCDSATIRLLQEATNSYTETDIADIMFDLGQQAEQEQTDSK